MWYAAVIAWLRAVWLWIKLHWLSFFRRYRKKYPQPTGISMKQK